MTGVEVLLHTTSLTGTNFSFGVALGDLDGDGYLDAFVANNGQANRVYINNGSGGFATFNRPYGYKSLATMALL